MAKSIDSEIESICRRLGIDDWRYVEIESKRRVLPKDVKDIRNFLSKQRKVSAVKTSFFFDQFLDTPDMALLKAKASLRLRYKKGGSSVYLQYKGPGFRKNGLLFRSEFSTERLKQLLREESHHDVIHFAHTSVREILTHHSDPAMARAMHKHLGARIISRISTGPILSSYKKEKFIVELGPAFLEPSLDRVFAFHIGNRGPHPLSTFWEYENEIKTPGGNLEDKLEYIPALLKFDSVLCREFSLRPEPLDKYRRCVSSFLTYRR